MRYSWEAESYVAETEGDPRDRDTPSLCESRVECDAPSSPATEEVEKKKILTGGGKRNRKGAGRGQEMAEGYAGVGHAITGWAGAGAGFR